MARMHSGKKGKARSYKPIDSTPKPWMKYKAAEIEKVIVKLAKAGETPSRIGLHLRDQYGIPDVKPVLKISITKVLEKNKLLSEIPEDLMAMLKKEVFLRKHLEANHKDEGAKRGLILAQAKAKRLIKYYKRSGKLSEKWKYDPKRIALLVE